MTPQQENLKLRCEINSLKMEIEKCNQEFDKIKKLEGNLDDNGLVILEQFKVVNPPDFEKLIVRICDLEQENKSLHHLLSNSDISSIERIISEMQKTLDKLLNRLVNEYNKFPIGIQEREVIEKVLIPYLEERIIELRKLLNA